MGGSQSAQASNYMSLSENTQQSATNIATFNASASSNLVNVINVTDVTCAGNFTVSDISQCNYGSTTLTASNTVDNSNDLSSDLSQDMSQVSSAQAMGTAFGDQSTTASSYMTASMSSSQTMLNQSMTACTTETSEKNEININNINSGGDCDISDINQCNTDTDVNSCTADVTQSNTGSITMSQTASQEDTATDMGVPVGAIFLLFVILVVVFCCCFGAVAKDVTQILLDTSTSFLPWFFMVIGLGCIGAGIYFFPFKYRQDKEAAANYAACGEDCETRMLGWTNFGDASDVPTPNQFDYETNVCSAQGQLKCAGDSWPGTDGATSQYCLKDADCPVVNSAQTVCSGGLCTKACGANLDCFPDDTGNDKTTGGGVNAFNFCTAEKCAVGVCTGEGWVGGEMVFVSSSNDEYTVDVNAILNADDGSGNPGDGSGSSGDGSGSSGDGSGSPVIDVDGTRQYVNGLPCSTAMNCVTYCTPTNTCAHDPSIDCSSNADCSNAPGVCSVASCVSSYGGGACPEPYVDVSGSGLYDASNGIFDRSLNQMCSTAGRLNCTSWTDPTSSSTSSSTQPKYEAYPALMYWGTRAAAPFSLMPRFLLQSATETSVMGPTPAQYACGALLGGTDNKECLMEAANSIDDGVATVLEPAANSMALFWDSRRISFPLNWPTDDLTGNPSADAGGLSCLGSNVTNDTLLGPNGCGASSVADNVLISRGAGDNTGMCQAQGKTESGCENSDNNTCKAGNGPQLRAVLTAWSFGGPIISGNCSVYTSMGTMDNNAFGRAAYFRPPFSDIVTYVYGNGGLTKTNTIGQYASLAEDGTGYQNELQPLVDIDGGEPQLDVDSSGGGRFVRHVCGGNSAAMGSDFAGQTIYEPCVTPYPTGQFLMENPSDVSACLRDASAWRTSRYEWILENVEDWDITLDGDGDDLDKALKADACPVDDLTMYLPRMINLPVTQTMHRLTPNTLDGKYHNGFLHTRSTLRPTIPDAFTGTFAGQYMLDYQLGAELDVMWADEIIGNPVAYPGVSLRWCYAACAGASRWRDQIDNPSLEYELLVYRTGTVSEPTPKGLMQGQMLGNTVSTAISQTAYYLKDHIANADAIQGSGDGTCTGFLQSNGCGGYRGGQLCPNGGTDAASLTSSCFNVIMYVGPFAANNYIAPWLEDKERTKVSFKTNTSGNPGGLFAPRTEGECLDKETGELLGCQLDVSGNPMPYANEDSSGGTIPNCADTSGCAGNNITSVASALRRVGRNVDAAMPFWHIECYSVSIGDEDGVTACANAMGGTVAAPNDPISACIQDWTNCDATCGFKDWATDTMMGGGQPLYNSEQQMHPVQGELIGNVLQGVDVAAGNFFPACNANVNGAAGMCDPTVNASTLTNFTHNGCCVADSCAPSTALEGELAAQADIKMFPLYGPASVGGYISMCAGTHFLCNTNDDCPSTNTNDDPYLTALNGYRATQSNWDCSTDTENCKNLNDAAKNNMGAGTSDGDVYSPSNYDDSKGCQTYFVYGPTNGSQDPMQFNALTAEQLSTNLEDNNWIGTADGFPGDVINGKKQKITAGFGLATNPVFEVSVNELAARSGAGMTSADLPAFAHNPLLNGSDQDVVVQPWDYSDINRATVWNYVNDGYARQLGGNTNNSIDTSTQGADQGPTWWTGQRDVVSNYGTKGQSCVPLGVFQEYDSSGSTQSRFGGGNGADGGANPSIFWKNTSNATFLRTDDNGAVACVPAVTGADGRPLYSLMAPPIHLRSEAEAQQNDQKGAFAQGVATTIQADDTGENECTNNQSVAFSDPLTGLKMYPCSNGNCDENYGFCSARSYMYQYYDGGAGKPMALYQGGMMTESDKGKFICKNNDQSKVSGQDGGAAGSTMQSNKSTNPEQWNYCTQNSDCLIPTDQLQALFGDREIPWWYDLSEANSASVLCIGGAQDEFYQNLQSTGNYSKYVNPIGGQRLTSAKNTGSSDVNSQNAAVPNGANLVDFTTGVAGMCYIANPTGKSKSDPTCFSGGTVPCWGFQPPEVTSGTSSVPYCGAVKPFTDTDSNVNTNFVFDVDAPCATFTGGNGDGDAVFCDTTKSGQHCTRGVTDNVWWANSASWEDNDTALMASTGCTLSIEDKAYVSKMGNWATTWTADGYAGPLTNGQWASPIDSSGTGVNLSVGPFDLQSKTEAGQGGVTTFATVPPACALAPPTDAIPMGAPTLDPQFNCPARQNCYVASTPGSSATGAGNLNLEGYEYHSALAAAGISGSDVNNAEAPPIVLYGASGAVSNIVSNQYTTQNCVHDSILNVCSNGGLEDLYMNDTESSSTTVPQDANILEGGASWPHVLYHDVQASGVGTTEASGLTFVDLCSADPCFKGANDNQGLCQSDAAGAVAAERGYCVTESVCSAWGGTWDPPGSRGCVTSQNQGPLAKADLNVLWTQVGDDTDTYDDDTLYRKLCAKTHGVYQYGDSSGGGACVYPSCTTTARTTLSRLAQSSELMIFGLDAAPMEQTFFFLRSPNQSSTSTADKKYKMLVIPGQMAWVPACGGNCNVYGNSTADLTNLGAWTTPSFITMYTGGISDTQQGYKPIVENSSVKNYQADFVFFVILCVFGVMFIGAGVLLLQKQRKRATDKADPGAALKESTAAVAGVVSDTGKLFGSATAAAGAAAEGAGDLVKGAADAAGGVMAGVGNGVAGATGGRR